MARQLRARVHIRAGAERVWAALLELEQLRAWWGASEGLIEPRKGGAWALAWVHTGPGYRHVLAGVIRSLLPARRLRLEPLIYFNADHPVPGPMRMSFSLSEKEGMTRLLVRQEPLADVAGWQSYAAGAQEGWREALANLKRYLEGGNSTAEPASSTSQ